MPVSRNLILSRNKAEVSGQQSEEVGVAGNAAPAESERGQGNRAILSLCLTKPRELSRRIKKAPTLRVGVLLGVLLVSELVHGVVFTRRFQGRFAAEMLLVVVANIRARHVLVLDASDALTDFLTLRASHITQHALVAEVFLGQIVGRQCGGMVGRQRNQVVEDTCFARRVGLEGADLLVGGDRQFGLIVFHTHQLGALVCSAWATSEPTLWRVATLTNWRSNTAGRCTTTCLPRCVKVEHMRRKRKARLKKVNLSGIRLEVVGNVIGYANSARHKLGYAFVDENVVDLVLHRKQLEVPSVF
jgi:hypothetical protein